ncbi:MAG: trypsin-like peptidase domain-containing protein [Fibrobacterota bacterium]
MSGAQKKFLFVILVMILGWLAWCHWGRSHFSVGGHLGGLAINKKELLTADETGHLLPLIAERVRPSVVAVRAVTVRETVSPYGPPVRVRAQNAGSGVILTRKGHIVTNAHIVNNAETITVTLADRTEVPATMIGLDTLSDIAVIKVQGRGLTPARLADSDSLQTGEWVLALGSPLGLAGTVTFGILSATGREAPFATESAVDYLQTDASINPGNSGGPLVNLDGAVAGINTMLVSPSGENSGIGFALPANLVRFAVESILRHGAVIRGRLGLDIQTITAATADAMERPSTQGALVARVHPGSPAAAAGLQAGDIILRFDKLPVRSLHDLRTRAAYTTPGKAVAVRYWRSGKTAETSVTMGRQGGPAPAGLKGLFKNKRESAWKSRRLGLTLMQDKAGPDNAPALFVQESEWDASPENPQVGDQLLKINATVVASLSDIKAVEEEIDRKDAVLLLLSRRGTLFYTSIIAR